MAEMPHNLSVGCLVTITATESDEDECPLGRRWISGALSARNQLQARVTGIRRRRIVFLVSYDDITYNVGVGFLTHDPLTCAQCMPKITSRSILTTPNRLRRRNRLKVLLKPTPWRAMMMPTTVPVRKVTTPCNRYGRWRAVLRKLGRAPRRRPPSKILG